MKAVILAGGLGTRISEETSVRPKPMVEIGGHPVLWHILKMYSQHGIFDFVICLGYKGYVIKEYFANYFLHTADVTFHMPENRMEVHGNTTEPWRITLVDTGDGTGTGGRLKRIAPHIQNEETFCLTYGDGVSDVDITSSIAFHRSHGKLATLTAVQPSARFGLLGIEGDQVRTFQEKPKGDGGWINGGFFVLSPKVIDYIGDNPSTTWEREPLERLAADDNLYAYHHLGFWQPMDTLRDKHQLDELWNTGRAPWKTW
jgi:glucose-1-phosphate cytidylyltransferase